MKKQKVKKSIGIYTLIGIGLGSIIGSGIFALPAAMGAIAGPGLILSIIIAGFISIFFALAYAEMGATYSIEGGPYAFPRLAMGDLIGFLMGWGYFIYLFVGTAAIIDIFVVYLGFYIPGLAIGGTLTFLGIFVALAFLWIFTYINIKGVKYGGAYSLFTTIGKLIPLLIFFVVGLFFTKKTNFSPFIPFGITGVTLAVTMFFWSFTGFEAIVVPSEEIEKPHKTIPVAMILTMIISISVYLLISIVFVGMIDWRGMGLSFKEWGAISAFSAPLSDIAKGLNFAWLAAIATIGAIIATGGSGGTWVLIQGRLPHAMAKDNLFCKQMSQLHPKFQTPTNGLILSSVLSSIVLITLPHFASVALIASITVLIPYAGAMISLVLLRKKSPEINRPFKVPVVKIFSLTGFILATILVYWASWPWTLVGAILLFTGYPASLFLKTKKIHFLRQNIWFPIYIIGIVLISFIGDSKFCFNNFTSISPLGYLNMPYDLIVLSVFAIIIFLWAYRLYGKPNKIAG